MSKGPGIIERRVEQLFETTRDRALSVADVADVAFELDGATATREQRLSATRAAHRLLRRMKETAEEASRFCNQAWGEAKAAYGGNPPPSPRFRRYAELQTDAYKRAEEAYSEYQQVAYATPAFKRFEKLNAWVKKFGTWTTFKQIDRDHFKGKSHFWRATMADGVLYFHPPDVPVAVWAADVQPAGVVWARAEITKITERNVMVRYAGKSARLDRGRLWRSSWVLWRNVRFLSSRTGRGAKLLDDLWRERYGGTYDVPAEMRLPLADAIALLGVPADYTEADVLAAFRREAKKAHPDLGGTEDQFHKLVEARDRLLAALGTNAPPPKPPTYAPKGANLVYRRFSLDGPKRLASTKRLPG